MKKVLYLGLTPPNDLSEALYTHCPIIRIVPRNPDDPSIKQAYHDIEAYTHYIFTSKNSVHLFLKYLNFFKYSTDILKDKTLITVGEATSCHLEKHGLHPTITAKTETAEGIVNELKQLSLDDAYVFWPHSALSRPVLTNALTEIGVTHRETILYDTVPLHPERKPNIQRFDEILFTSPSTVDAFIDIFGSLPNDIKLTAIGPVTRERLDKVET